MAASAGYITVELLARVKGNEGEPESLGFIQLPVTYKMATGTLEATIKDAVDVTKATLEHIFKDGA